MHDIRWIRENPDAFDRALARRGLSGEAKRLIALDERRRAVIQKLEMAQARRNAASKEIGDAKKKKDEATAQKLMAEVNALKESMPAMEAEEKAVSDELDDALAQIPNLPLAEVPDGADAAGNVEHHHFGAKRNYAFAPKQHFDLGEALGMMDFEAAARLSGARFVVLKKGLARLERALAQFMLNVHTDEHGYTEVNPPLMVQDDVMFGTAQLPKFEEDQFYVLSSLIPKLAKNKAEEGRQVLAEIEKVEGDTQGTRETIVSGIKALLEKSDIKSDLQNALFKYLDRLHDVRIDYGKDYVRLQRELLEYIEAATSRRWLIPTAEVPLTNLVREQIVDEDTLPLRMTACTPCFRAEAGAAGKDTRGMIRQHQFTKVELVSITTPEKSKDEHERMLSCAEEILRRLDLHYRVMTLCTGDMGFASQKTYDIEVWLPGQGMYREISSCSVCGEFQARRMQARYRTKENRAVRHVHTLNGSGVAVGRAMIAVMENYQQENGSIAVPQALQPYMGGMKVIEKA